MANILSNYIDFRDEHRIYLLDGVLWELVGMIAFSDYDDRDEEFGTTSPKTSYKFIFNSELMQNGGFWEEGFLPPIFAHRGDTLNLSQVVCYLVEHCLVEDFFVENVGYIFRSPVDFTERLDLHIDSETILCDISIKLIEFNGGYNIKCDFPQKLNLPWMFIYFPSDGRKGIMISHSKNGYERKTKFYTFKAFATVFGEIIYSLREYFDREVEIVDIKAVSRDDTPIDLPKSYEKFLRLINIAADKEEKRKS